MNAQAINSFHAPLARRVGAKPLTATETQARQRGKAYFELALSYRDANDVHNAVSCCLEGLAHTDGISRPLMVRDQLTDLVDSLDPKQELRSQIRSAGHIPPGNPQPALAKPQHSARQPRSTYLERLVSCHQLLDYPSEYRRFNQTYEDALACARNGSSVREFYIVQYRSTVGSGANDLYFSFVPAVMISADGPYYLTDICAVVRAS